MQVAGWSQITHGPGHYAPTTFLDADEQPCVLFWIRGVGDADAGWSGALSIPYRLALVDGRVALSPHPVLAAARPDTQRTAGFTWRPAGAGRHRLRLGPDDDSSTADLVRDGNTLTITTAGRTVRVPVDGDRVDVLMDGCVLEIATEGAVVGLPCSAVPPLAAPSADVTPWWG